MFGWNMGNVLFHEPEAQKTVGFANIWNMRAHQCVVHKKTSRMRKKNGISYDLKMWDIQVCGEFHTM